MVIIEQSLLVLHCKNQYDEAIIIDKKELYKVLWLEFRNTSHFFKMCFLFFGFIICVKN